MATTRFELVRPEDTPHWDRFVEGHPKGTIFHTSAMIRVYEATDLYQPLAVAACNQDGLIVALLVAVCVQTLPGLAGCFASRSIHYAEPLCCNDAAGIDGLVALIRHHDQLMNRKTLFADVRPIWPSGAERIALETCGYHYQDYLNYVVDLSRPGDELWKSLSKSCRQQIRRSERRGVVIHSDASADTIDQMYAHLQLSYRRSQVPLADRSLFHAALALLPQNAVQVRLAYHQDRPVASGIALIYKGLIYAWYGGTERVGGIAPFDCLTWSEIQWGRENGLQLYDFGGAGWPDEAYGPRDFKAKFGGALVHYGRYRKVYSPRKLRLAEITYRMARQLVSQAR